MVKYFQFNRKKLTAPPGTLIHVGEELTQNVRITEFIYDETEYKEKEIHNLTEIKIEKDKPTITWINVDGIHDAKIIEQIGNIFDIHPLVLEDIMNSEQRIKVEDFETYIFIVLKMIYYRDGAKCIYKENPEEMDMKNSSAMDDDKPKNIVIEQISLLVGPNYVISFQECVGDIFDLIRERIRNSIGRTRKAGADYLAYSLIDAIVDNYYIILESFGERIEEIEDELVTKPTVETLQILQTLKREMVFLRRSVLPLREIINFIDRSEAKLIKKPTRIYFRDIYDHIVHIMEIEEGFREMVAGMLDIYLSSISNKLNEVMKVLTIIATIFIPLTFIAGVYGMNFIYLPEKDWIFGYPLTLIIMLSVALTMLFYFKRKKWI